MPNVGETLNPTLIISACESLKNNPTDRESAEVIFKRTGMLGSRESMEACLRKAGIPESMLLQIPFTIGNDGYNFDILRKVLSEKKFNRAFATGGKDIVTMMSAFTEYVSENPLTLLEVDKTTEEFGQTRERIVQQMQELHDAIDNYLNRKPSEYSKPMYRVAQALAGARFSINEEHLRGWLKQQGVSLLTRTYQQ